MKRTEPHIGVFTSENHILFVRRQIGMAPAIDIARRQGNPSALAAARAAIHKHAIMRLVGQVLAEGDEPNDYDND